MKLTDFINQLNKLASDGYHECEVFYRRGSSGDCGSLSGAHVSTEVTECGPFDLKEDEQYISISAGN